MKFIITFFTLFLFLISCSGNNTTQSNNSNVQNKKNSQSKSSNSTNTDKKDKKLKLNSKLVITKHAQCRMDCKKIDLEEIKEIISKGQINVKKSDTKKKPCPILAIEGTTKEKQKVRLVLAACKEETKIITVIDLNQKIEDPSCKNCK